MLLLDVPVVFMCPDHNEKYKERKEYMFDFLQKLGFKNVIMFKSGTELYPRCHIQATYDILKSRIDDSPFLFLEDDVELTEWGNDMNIDIPENTDAFYLGFSKYAGSLTNQCGNGYNSVNVSHISDKNIRIINMLSHHAVLYISRRYKEAVMNQMETLLNSDQFAWTDVTISRIQEKYNIFAYKYPFFYQSDKFGNHPDLKDATNFRF